MSFFHIPLPLLTVAVHLLMGSVRALNTVTVVSKGNAVATTTGSGGAQPANDGIVIPFVNPAGGPILVSTVHPSTITPPPSKEASNPPSDPNCQQCSIYFEYINVYYWPTGNTHNTACLSGVTDKPITALPSGLKPKSPSVYLVFPTISAGNACSRVGKVYISKTFSFAPHALSTMVGTSHAKRPFNFADLPCPPPDVASADHWFYNRNWNPGRAYAPMVSPPPEIFDMDPAFKHCVAAVYQGFDPPFPMPTEDGGGLRRKRTAPAHVVPSGPVQIPSPIP